MTVCEPHIRRVSVEKIDQLSRLHFRQTFDIADICTIEEENRLVRLRMTRDERVNLSFESRVVARDGHVAHTAVHRLHPP